MLRNLFGTFLTGVTIITLREADGASRGFTANSFTSVSLDPRESRAHPATRAFDLT